MMEHSSLITQSSDIMDDTWSGFSSSSDPGDIDMNASDDLFVCSRRNSETAEPDGLLDSSDKREPDKKPSLPGRCASVKESVPTDKMDIVERSGKECLTQLPEELKQLIFNNLNLVDKINLKLSCRYFYNYIPTYTHKDYLRAEQLQGVKSRFFACCFCCRLRPRAKFLDNSRVHGKAPGGKKAKDRFCLDCGLKQDEHGHAKLSRGTWVTINKTACVVCEHCGILGKTHKGHGTKSCEDCWRSHVQPRLEAHANPVLPVPVEVDNKHHIGYTWVSNYTTPNDVVQSAILVGVSTPNSFAKHKKWDTNGDEIIVEGEMDAENSDSTFKNRSLAFVPRLINCRNNRSTYRRNYPPTVYRASVGPSNENLANRHWIKAVTLANKKVVSDFASSASTHIPAKIGLGAAGPGPATLANQAQSAASVGSSDVPKSLNPKIYANVPIYAQKAKSTCGPAFSANEMKTLAQRQYHIWEDIDMKPACALKVNLSARSFSKKPAPPVCGVHGNSGNIIAGNYLKAREALNSKDEKRRLGWHTINIRDTSMAADVVDDRTRALTNDKTQSTISRKRKAQDSSHQHSPTCGGSSGPGNREKRRRITEESDDEWEGFSSPISPSSPPKLITKSSPEKLPADPVAKINRKLLVFERKARERKARDDQVADLKEIPVLKKGRPRVEGVLDFYLRKKRRLVEKKVQKSGINSTGDVLGALRAKALATIPSKGSKAKKQKKSDLVKPSTSVTGCKSLRCPTEELAFVAQQALPDGQDLEPVWTGFE